ncbi:MAG: hypothetical protein V2J26_05970 [Pacificimonas sp.]|jgi:hypothetical protein|nr:hypothetical protein [Pacificimonas sp.]
MDAATVIIPNLPWIIAGAMALGGAAIGGWVVTTWMRVKNGYPLDGAWGQAVYPKTNSEDQERIKLLTQENGQLRAEIGSVKDRLAAVETIVTDGAHRLTADIERLRDDQVN